MINCQYVASTMVYFGKNRTDEIGKLVKNHADKILLIYGGGSIKRTGLYDRVMKSLSEANVRVVELSGVKPNPDVSKVYEGIRICREENVRFLLAVGGGSAIDTAKSIAIGVEYAGDVWDFFSGKATIQKSLPIASILTIPGSGSESSANCVLSDIRTEEKIGIGDVRLRPLFTILDPELCVTIPEKQIAPGVYDMLSHTMERYFTNTIHTDIDDGVSEGVMRGIIQNGLRVIKDHTDVDAWGELMVGANLSHNWVTGIGREQDWSNHGMEEVVSGMYTSLPHGSGLSIITSAWMRYVYKKHVPMFVQFAVNVMGVRGSFREQEKLALEGIEALEEFSRKMGLPIRFSDVGIDDTRFREMAERCVSYKESGSLGNLEKLTADDVEKIYRMAL